ncbi:MAG: DUF3300 domain-containing protein [Bacteroidia bacterium]|nr:DUF3300 domain-containing protein [Bacteroidia bacterium]
MITIKKTVSLIFISVSTFFLPGQEQAEMLLGNMKADSATVTAIAIYPAAARKNILEACTYPDALVKMEEKQKTTSGQFRKLLEPYSKEVQQQLWEMTRYPGLIVKLDRADKKSKKEIEKIAAAYPEEIRASIKTNAGKYAEVFTAMNRQNKQNETEFNQFKKEYPEKTQEALKAVVNYPEVVSVLTSDMRSAVVIGDIYKRKPDWLMAKMDSISTAYAAKNAQDMEEWRRGLEKNPEAKKEMEEAGKEFAKDNGYTTENTVRTETIVVNYVYEPYPYWWGYPYWYDYPYWYPQPVYYNWGYYYGPGGIVYTGYPSPYFTYWYFHHHHHHYQYPHFSDYCIGHYYGHRETKSGFNKEVGGWMKKNEPSVPENFFKNDKDRPDRIKEFGKSAVEYDLYKKDHPAEKITRDEFVKSKPASFPHLNQQTDKPGGNRNEEIKKPEQIQPQKNVPLENPDVKPVEKIEPVPTYKPVPQQKNPEVKPQYNPQPKQEWKPEVNPQNNPQPKQVPVPRVNPQPKPVPVPRQNPVVPRSTPKGK